MCILRTNRLFGEMLIYLCVNKNKYMHKGCATDHNNTSDSLQRSNKVDNENRKHIQNELKRIHFTMEMRFIESTEILS